MSPAALAVALLVLLAVICCAGSPVGRLRRLAAPGRRTREVVHATGTGGPRGLLGRRVPPGPEPAETVGELAALLRAGLSPAQAWQLVPAGAGGAWGRVLARAGEAAAHGGDVPAALRATARELRCGPERSAAHAVAAACRVAERTGAPAARVLERLAEALRSDADASGAREAAMAGPRATGRILTWLPVGGLAVGQLIGADPVQVLVSGPAGWACAGAGAALAAVGAWWTHRLVRAAQGTR